MTIELLDPTASTTRADVAPNPLTQHTPPTEHDVLTLLAGHSYDEVRQMTGWSRGKIYAAACRHRARKTEDRIQARRQEKTRLQREFLAEVMGTTVKMDVIDFLAGNPDASADLVITSPPFNLGKRYGNAGIDAMSFSYFHGFLVMCIAEMARILKPGGTLCLDLGSTRDWTDALYPMDVMLFEDIRRAGLTFQSRVAWTYEHGLTPRKRLTERYDTLLVFSKGEQAVFNPNAARIPQKEPGKRAFKGPNKGNLSGHPMGAAPSNVWRITPVGSNHPEKTDHPCQLPVALLKRAIHLWTNAGGHVVDPFSGSGSTHAACIETGRGFVGADLFYEDTRRARLAKVMPDLVSLLPGVSDESVAVWQAEARRVELTAGAMAA